MRVWVVLFDQGGAHEPDGLLSVWTTESAAHQEARRVYTRGLCGTGIWVTALEADVSSDDDVSGDVRVVGDVVR